MFGVCYHFIYISLLDLICPCLLTKIRICNHLIRNRDNKSTIIITNETVDNRDIE